MPDTSNDKLPIETTPWHYERNGTRLGPIPENELRELITNNKVFHDSLVWCAGMPQWMKVEGTSLATSLGLDGPPPLSADKVDNTIIWVVAFVPIIGLFLEYVVAGAVYGGNEYLVELNIHKFWWITLGLNIILCLWDEKKLKNNGHNTERFRGFAFILVPVYIYKRAHYLKHNMAYFFVWILSFLLSMFL